MWVGSRLGSCTYRHGICRGCRCTGRRALSLPPSVRASTRSLPCRAGCPRSGRRTRLSTLRAWWPPEAPTCGRGSSWSEGQAERRFRFKSRRDTHQHVIMLRRSSVRLSRVACSKRTSTSATSPGSIGTSTAPGTSVSKARPCMLALEISSPVRESQVGRVRCVRG